MSIDQRGGFLEDQDLAKLTGIKTGHKGETREQLQIKQLRSMGIAFVVNARGVPVVTWAAVEGTRAPQVNAQQGWTPRVLTNKKAA